MEMYFDRAYGELYDDASPRYQIRLDLLKEFLYDCDYENAQTIADMLEFDNYKWKNFIELLNVAAERTRDQSEGCDV